MTRSRLPLHPPLQRLRILRQTCPPPEPNAILMINLNLCLTSLKSLTDNLHETHVEGLIGDDTNVERIAAHLGQREIHEVGKFYDRDPKAYDWYYQCYGPPPSRNIANPTPNSTAEWLGLHNLNSEVIILKNGPSCGSWKGEPRVDLEAVARTMWWYLQSGNDRAQVFGEREFARFIKNL